MDILEVFKALSNPVRLTIVQKLKEPKKHFPVADQLVDADQEGVCVSIIQETSGLSQSTVSSYLATLHRAGIIQSRRIGPWTYYKRNEENIQIFMKQLAEQI
ncbi:ArsR/SmtB family transcription factor [Candidatus Venteria ishoeyi]|uniref:DNA-binding transcriptional repressor ArsR n=1 Tax=Candidatus Venteria ishoeyi TaxID=1899563 RepID=A0A1H6FHX8_9GAMM|nr:metalloregulator ArsR/SmtB family transcription factor [Candidatus Venteria ishoeyi]MDM8547392.1 metalloregulator ArsR/SmtB family transcription factor [Candidatus Venteria ishoeyi]SEH08746.1 DNA-binding transcriptional repressor ArsR [Candidatus Venteria ishoeyi]